MTSKTILYWTEILINPRKGLILRTNYYDDGTKQEMLSYDNKPFIYEPLNIGF